MKHNTLGYIRAIRVLNEVINSEDSPAYQKFLRECKVLLRLGNGNHKNIVHIYQPRFLENHALVEMDYVDGCDISKYLKSNDNFVPTEEVLRMVEEMSSALAYCHEDIYKFCMDRDEDHLIDDPNDGSKVLIDKDTERRLIEKYKVIHNDIHSGNIMRRSDGSFVLLDFGLAITGNDDVRHSSRHENGAVEFKAPEKWDNEAILTEQSDIYSFGVVMYEYLAGMVPFPFNKKAMNRTEEEFKLSRAHKTERPPAIYDIRKANFEAKYPDQTYEKDYPDWLEEAIMKCLEKDPEKRFRNGKELHDFIVKHIKKEKVFLKKENKGGESGEERVEKKSAPESSKDSEHIESSGHSKKKHGFWIPLLAIIVAVFGIMYFFQTKETVKEITKAKQIVEKHVADSIKQVKKAQAAAFTNKTFTINGVSFEMIAVKGGTFTMGCTSEQSDCWGDETPTHSVTLSDYYIGKFEVTQELWYAVMGSNPSYFKGNNLPVETVSWNDVQEFITKLNQKTGANFRLPTEAEWEYAARGGNKSNSYKYSGSNTIGNVAWYWDNSNSETHQVGTKSPNELGIYDMSGNVWEWCQDWYGDYSSGSQTNPIGSSSGSFRVLRGGSWNNRARLCRVSLRNYYFPDRGSYYFGFRLVLVP